MIFVTVGTERFPFDRLLKAIDNAVKKGELKQEVFAQIGNSTFIPKSFSYETFIDYDRMVTFIKKADIIVSHAGEGTLFLCLSLGKIPILFPRKAVFREHLDNHQIELAKKMEERKKIITAYTEEELIYKINNYGNLINQLKQYPDDNSKKRLINYLAHIIHEMS